jgi:hypothetical protein
MIEFVIIDPESPIGQLVKSLAKSTDMPITESKGIDRNIIDSDGLIYFGAINTKVQEIAEKCKNYGRHCIVNPTLSDDIVKWCRDNRIEIVYIAGDENEINEKLKPMLVDTIMNIIM